MKSPFRKLIRISIVLFATVLLFNFFGYYLMHIKYAENKELNQSRSISGRQQTLSQVISKEVAILTGNLLTNEQSEILKDTLAKNLVVFEQQQEFLQKHIEQ